MKVKTSELNDLALDWVVASIDPNWQVIPEKEKFNAFLREHKYGNHHYSSSWKDGGPIIARESISFRKYHNPKSQNHGKCYAKVCKESGAMVYWSNRTDYTGETELIAAMRCLVASKLGDEIDIPEELL